MGVGHRRRPSNDPSPDPLSDSLRPLSGSPGLLLSGPLRELQAVRTSANHLAAAAAAAPPPPGNTKSGLLHSSLLHSLIFLQSHTLFLFTGRISK